MNELIANPVDTSADLEHGQLVEVRELPFSYTEFLSTIFEQLDQQSSLLSYNASRNEFSGKIPQRLIQPRKLTDIFAEISSQMHSWLTEVLPNYSDGLVPDSLVFRAGEEATRPFNHSSRDHLFHLDVPQKEASLGRRRLKLCVNLHTEDTRVWATSERFSEILQRYSAHKEIPGRNKSEWMLPIGGLIRLFSGGDCRVSNFDSFAIRLNQFLLENRDFQTRAARKIWNFVPGSSWLFFSDMLSHAELRGRCSLEHNFWLNEEFQVFPGNSPINLLVKNSGHNRERQAG